jgi:hypothetical protein
LRTARNLHILHMPMEWMNVRALTSSVAGLTSSENISWHTSVPVVQYWQVPFSCLSCSCYKESGLPHIFSYYDNSLNECVKRNLRWSAPVSLTDAPRDSVYIDCTIWPRKVNFTNYVWILIPPPSVIWLSTIVLNVYHTSIKKNIRFCVLLIFVSSPEPAIWYFYTALYVVTITALLIQEMY